MRLLESGPKGPSFGAEIARLNSWGKSCELQLSPEGAAGMTERRTARRYDLSLPVNVRVPVSREPKPQTGRTRDISTRGVYFIMQNEVAPGTELDFTLTLPAEITHGNDVFVRAHGRVVRVDKRSDETHESTGVAAVIERYDIIRGESSHL
jgi:hypothetical protein